MAIKTAEQLTDHKTVNHESVQEKIATSLAATAFRDPSGRIYRLHGYDVSTVEQQSAVLEAEPGIFTESEREIYEVLIPASSRPTQYARISLLLHGVAQASCMSVEVAEIVE